METNNNKYECYQHFKNIFFLVLSRIAMHSIRYGLLLRMWRGLYVRVCLSTASFTNGRSERCIVWAVDSDRIKAPCARWGLGPL